MIPPELEERVREAWFRSTPRQYRWTGKDHSPSNLSYGAIIAPSPSDGLLKKFLRFFDRVSATQHLTEKQKAAQAARQNCGRPGARKGAP